MNRNLLCFFSLLLFASALMAQDEMTQMAQPCNSALAPQQKPVPPPGSPLAREIESVVLTGQIGDDDNIGFSVEFEAEFKEPGMLAIVSGVIAETSHEIRKLGGGFFFGGGDFRIVNSSGSYFLKCVSPGKCALKFEFASRVEKNENWRSTTFTIPPAISRSVSISVPRKDMELQINGALQMEKKDAADGNISTFSAILPPDGPFSATWRGNVEKIDAELVASAEAGIVALVLPGTVKMSSIFNYSVIQGKMKELEFKLSPDLNILNVRGENVQDWKIIQNGETQTLHVLLSREYDRDYKIFIESEKILKDFPCKFTLPIVSPQKVLRFDGAMAFGTNGAIKLIVEKSAGLSQTDTNSFPRLADHKGDSLQMPRRSVFTYRFSGGDYVLETGADNIISSYMVDLSYIVNFKNEDMYARAACSLDIKDAPLRELMLRYDGDMTVNRVEGPRVVPDDYELLEKDGAKWIKIPFLPDTMGKTDLYVSFEKNVKDPSKIKIPSLFIENTKSLRGYLLLSAARGLLINPVSETGLRRIHSGSSPVREPGLQYAYRLKGQEWNCEVSVSREKATIVSNIFNISSVGEGTVYVSSAFTFHISGAPVSKLLFTMNPQYRNIEFTGRDIVDWKKLSEDESSQIWQVNFKDKIFGDFNLLATCEFLLPGAEAECVLGDIGAKDAQVETGDLVVCSVRNLKLGVVSLSETMSQIESDEIPSDCRAMIQNPMLAAFKIIGSPHGAKLKISGYSSQKLLDIAVDVSRLSTRIDRNGEAVTKAEYRIKNSSRQFLSISLPGDSKLWSVKVDGEARRVSSADGKLLIPIPRKQGTNEPIAVEVEYARQYGRLGSSSKLMLEAPSLGLENMSTKWILQVPDNYDLVKFGGNMDPLRNPQLAGLGGLFRRLIGWAVLGMRPGFAVPWLLTVLACLILGWSWGGKKMRAISSAVSAILIVAAFFAASSYGLPRISPVSASSVSMGEFTRLFSVSQDVPRLEIEVMNMRGFSANSIFNLAAGAFAASALILCSLRVKSTLLKILLLSIALTAVLFAFSHWLVFNALAALGMALLIAILVPLAAWRFAFVRTRVEMLAKTAAAIFLLFFMLPLDAATPLPPGIQIEDASYLIQAKTKDDSTVSISAEASFKIKAEKRGSLIVLKSPAVLTKSFLDGADAEIVRLGSDYVLKIKDEGRLQFKMDFLIPLSDEGGGICNFTVDVPQCLKNSFTAKLDSKDLDIECPNAVSFRSETVGNLPQAAASFVPGSRALFRIRPKARNIEKEKVSFFTNIDSLANFAQGFVEISNSIGVQIAQGETAKFSVEVPGNMKVTSVKAKDLGAWRFEEDKHLLEIFLAKPKHGNYMMEIVTQIPNCNLPYEAKLGVLKVRDASREHGTVGISADASVQVQVESSEGLNSINTADFLGGSASAGTLRQSLKKAFRYQAMPASALVKAVPVDAEIRVEEKCSVIFEEERTVLNSDLSLEIAKSGIFSVTLDIPESFDIDRISGDAIQHWDEISEKGIHCVTVHFERRMIGPVSLRISLFLDKKRESPLMIPKISVRNSQKLKGELNISVERGTRMEIIDRKGLEVKTEGFASSRSGSMQSFTIVRADWELKASFETVAPWIQAEVLQISKLSEGAIETDARIHYSIENAGIKHFKIRLPANAETPEFSAANMLGFQKIGENIWEIELQQKVSEKFRLELHYRQSFGRDGKVEILPVVAEGAELQKGYLAILSDDALQIGLDSSKGEISEMDMRKIPIESFKIPYERLAKAVMCYRTIGGDFSVLLDVKRHKTAELLKAQIKDVTVDSSVSSEGRIISTVRVSLMNGNENFIRVNLPSGSAVWSVSIDGQAVDAARETDTLLIPLKQSISGGGKDQCVEIIYSYQPSSGWTRSLQSYNGPSFDLPLKNLTWNLYLPDKFEYSSFGGTLDWADTSFMSLVLASIEDYDAKNRMQRDRTIAAAKDLRNQASSFVKAGKISEAYEAYQTASALSQTDRELNSDIQGELQQVQRDQSIVALSNTRARMKKGSSKGAHSEENNLPDNSSNTVNAPLQIAPQVQSAAQAKQQLGSAETYNLQQISDKMNQQQQAAIATPHPLRPDLPEGGSKLTFKRALQIEPGAPMEVSFKAETRSKWRDFSDLASAFALTLALMLGLALLATAFRRTPAV